jgi:hypothetical protein|tara:strand:+ start:683 stop:985 length:303 start_codon:yes stop_codon:yes gene_type:complete
MAKRLAKIVLEGWVKSVDEDNVLIELYGPNEQSIERTIPRRNLEHGELPQIGMAIRYLGSIEYAPDLEASSDEDVSPSPQLPPGSRLSHVPGKPGVYHLD